MTEPLKLIVHAAEPEPLIARLQATHADVAMTPCDSYAAMDGLVEDVQPDIVYSIRFAGTPGFPRDALIGPAGPKWISVGGSGIDHLRGWDTSRTTVTNSAGVAAHAMAEYIIGCALHFSLDIPGLNADKRQRTWPGRIMTPLRGKTLLIVGLGSTGKQVARLAKALGMMVIGTRARPSPVDHVDEVHAGDRLGELWSRADIIAVCAPLLESTRNLIDQQAFAAMKESTVLIDVSRGGIVNQQALIDALASGKMKAAALDVFETEPLPPDNPLWEIENALISPHCSSVFDGWELDSLDMFSDNLSRWKKGEPLENVVDPDRGY